MLTFIILPPISHYFYLNLCYPVDKVLRNITKEERRPWLVYYNVERPEEEEEEEEDRGAD